MDKITIHGQPADGEWSAGNVEALRGRRWERQRWKRPRAIENRHGYCKRYYGQPFDAELWRIVELTDTHDHCAVCTWTIFDTEDQASGTAFTSEGVWICAECHERFFAGGAR